MQIACACTARCMLGLVVGADRPAKHASLGLVGYAQGLPGRGGSGALHGANERTGCWGVLSLGYGLAELHFP